MVEVTPAAPWRLGLAMVMVTGWQIFAGMAHPGSVTGPAGEVGLCLALAIWWLGGSSNTGLAVWGATLLSGAVLTGVAPLWMFVIGWPAWLCTRIVVSALRTDGLAWMAFVVMSAGLVSMCRCAGKLLLQAVPFGTVPTPTLSGLGVFDSLWAEAAPNVMFLILFGLLLGLRQPGRSEC